MGTSSAYIGIGSNIGDRLSNLQHAVDLLAVTPQAAVTALSRVYMTEPVGNVDQADFFNAVVKIETALDPVSLRARCKEIERLLGRPDDYLRWSPRTIDLDILLYGSLCMQDELLTIPHAELHRRKFVLVPLLDIDNPIHPFLHRTAAELLQVCGDPAIPTRLSGKLMVG